MKYRCVITVWKMLNEGIIKLFKNSGMPKRSLINSTPEPMNEPPKLDLKSLELRELNGRPVAVRPVDGVAKCGQCDHIAKWTVFEFWHGKRLDSDASQLHKVWHWCGTCEDSPFPSIADAR